MTSQVDCKTTKVIIPTRVITMGNQCSCCNEVVETRWNYCPRTGLKLDWGTIKRFYEGDY